MTPYFLILALLLALAPAVIAHGKGRNFLLWWLYGVVLGPIALIHSILLRSARRPARESMPDEREPWTSPWPLLLRVAASLAIAVVAVAVYRFFVPPEFEPVAGKQEIVVSADRTPSSPAPPPKTAAPDAGGTAAKAPDADAMPAAPPSPTVNVTVREDAPPPDTAASKEAAAPEPEKPAAPATPKSEKEPGKEPGKKAPDVASVPPPPPPSPAKSSNRQLERTVPLERTLAETSPPAPEKKKPDGKRDDEKQDTAKEVDTLAARAAPPEDAGSAAPDPVIAPTPREDTLRREPDEQPARRKPATRKASAPKPAPAPTPAQPPSPSPSDVTAVGDTVRVVQQALAARGYDPGPANGRAGRQTEQAIRKFQQDRGLKTTGTIDYAVLETLNIVGPRIHAFQPPPGTTPGR